MCLVLATVAAAASDFLQGSCSHQGDLEMLRQSTENLSVFCMTGGKNHEFFLHDSQWPKNHVKWRKTIN